MSKSYDADGGTNDLEKLASVLVVLKDGGFAVASGHHVVHRAGELQSGTSRHGAVMTKPWARRRGSETAEILDNIGKPDGDAAVETCSPGAVGNVAESASGSGRES